METDISTPDAETEIRVRIGASQAGIVTGNIHSQTKRFPATSLRLCMEGMTIVNT